MTIAYWCVLIAAVLPYAFTVAAKTQSNFTNRRPRAYLDSLEGWRKRAHWAQLNGFEAFPPFAAAVIIAHQLYASQILINALAAAFIAIRLLYGLCYVFDRPTLRSLFWFAGLLCVAGLFAISA